MYKKILLPLDGSWLSEAVLPYAVSFAQALRIPLELLHVVEVEALQALFEPKHGRPLDTVEAQLKSEALVYLEKVTATMPQSTTIAVARHVEIGTPAEVILNRAAAVPGTLVAMSTRGRSGIKRWLLGSVAEKVLHATRTPLLLIKAAVDRDIKRDSSFNRILVALDGSPLAEQILPYVAVLAKVMRLETELLGAYSLPVGVIGPQVYPMGAPLNDTTRMVEARRDEVKNYLTEKVRQLRAQGVESVSYAILQGQAADMIIETAQRTPNTLVALATHGRSGAQRWLLGSVAERVVRHSGDPVFLIRPGAQPA